MEADRVKAAVAEVGGEVTHELGVIRAVGARLSAGQREALLYYPYPPFNPWPDFQPLLGLTLALLVLPGLLMAAEAPESAG